MKAIAVVQARMGSTRLPGKVLRELAGRPVLGWVTRAAAAIPGIDAVTVATSDSAADDALAAWCAEQGLDCWRGSEPDVLERVLGAARGAGADVLLRLTGDCPLLDPQVCGEVLALLRRGGADYASNVEPRSWPDGLDCEAMTLAALEAAAEEAAPGPDREHVTPFLRRHQQRFRSLGLRCPIEGLVDESWTLDSAEDFAVLERLAARLPAERPPSYLEVLAAIEADPELAAASRRGARAPEIALTDHAVQPSRAANWNGYERSRALLERAERRIPLGSQTFSKSRVNYPVEASPLFLTHGRGGRVWDVDGNGYVDLVMGLLPLLLGYCDPDVDRAIREQLDRGITFSLATELEAELAERLAEMVPCAEMARFGKNGSDATSAAVRLARHHTGRDHLVVCGYHGWHDWYIGTTSRDGGVPRAVAALSHKVAYGDLEALAAALGAHEVAAVIMEPMTLAEPPPGYLEEVKALAHRHGALLVFDEIVTGFRFAAGGAQELFGVTPDLAAVGKGLGNGMPISAVVGRAEVMRGFEKVFFSGTMGGEALSLAAAIAVCDKLRREPVIETLWRRGGALAEGARRRIEAHGLAEVIALKGAAPWMVLDLADHPNGSRYAIKTLFLAEMLRRGVLISASHNLCYAHSEQDVEHVLGAYDEVLPLLAEALAEPDLDRRLDYAPIQPVFAVRGA